MNDDIFCPLVDAKIDTGECVENTDVVRGIIKEYTMPEEYKQKENWKEICKNCKYFYY